MNADLIKGYDRAQAQLATQILEGLRKEPVAAPIEAADNETPAQIEIASRTAPPRRPQ